MVNIVRMCKTSTHVFRYECILAHIRKHVLAKKKDYRHIKGNK